MASYTMELRNYIEMFSQDETLSTRDIIEKGRVKLFDFDYPIFDTDYKKVFETHFIREFYMREIGFETESLFKFKLENWLIINMPYFNKLFESELIQYDPLTNSKIDVSHKKTTDKDQTADTSSDGTSNSTSESDATGKLTEDNFNRKLESSNPDTRLTITSNDGQGVIEYASRIQEDNDNNSKTSSSNTTGNTVDTSSITGKTTASVNETIDYVESRIGKTGDKTYAKMVSEYRDTLLRIEKKIFNEMQELFMLVY